MTSDIILLLYRNPIGDLPWARNPMFGKALWL
jgi:hypothetical protein